MPIDEKSAGQPLLASPHAPLAAQPSRRALPTMAKVVMLLQAVALGLLLLTGATPGLLAKVRGSHACPLSAAGLEACAWSRLRHDAPLLDVPSIGRDEYLARQSVLAAELDKAGVDAFVAEPSASTSYYANVSASVGLSERPFLIVLSRHARFSYLVPKFEAGRIARLDMVYENKTVIEWAEEASPYHVFKESTGFSKVMLDEHARFTIATGLQRAGVDVVPMSAAVQSLRAVKSEAELRILRAVNLFTLQLLRSLQKCVRVGMTQETVTTAAHALFANAGIGAGFWAAVLFGDQAASPHGGALGKTLGQGEFVLVDIGSRLHDYSSDVTRTFLPDESEVSDELLDTWRLVHASQAVAVEHTRANETCSDVDAASRKVIAHEGYGAYFTHRLGHGLGLEMHEHPYLNGANAEKLKAGEVVSNEPGIYVTTAQARRELGRDVGFGVRLEDPILVTAHGGVPLTGRTAVSPYDP